MRKTLILISLILVLIISSLVVYYMNRDSDNDGIPDIKEREYGTDPNKPNYLLAYALKKLPENEALRFKDVDFNESSKGLVDLYASLSQDKRSSKEVNELLDNILSDNVIDDYEKNLFDDKFVNPSLPSIINLSWVPTRENLDKIYDINVTFTARDDRSPIAYAELHFVPVEYYYMIEKYGMRPEDYPKVFPPDKERDFVLTPVDGKFDSLEERFSVPIKDIVGGREYRIVVSVRDSAGNERVAEVKTPYIRQFENIAKTDNITVMASYMPWYTDPRWVNEHRFRGYPLLGAYNVRDPIVVYKHADWATGHGIDAFLMNWNGADKASDDNIFYISEILKNFKGAPRIGILWGPHPEVMAVNERGEYIMDDAHNRKEFLKEMEYLAKRYMNSPLYLVTNDLRPIIYFYESKALKGDIPGLIDECRDVIREATGRNPFIIGDEIGWLFTYPQEWLKISGNSLERLKSFDAVSDWAGAQDRSKQDYIDNYIRYLDNLYYEWSTFLKKYNIVFVGSAIPGFDEIYIHYKPDLPPIPKAPQLFEERLRIALKYTHPVKMIRIDTWNDWGEWTNVEPTVEEGMAYLEVLKKVLVKP